MRLFKVDAVSTRRVRRVLRSWSLLLAIIAAGPGCQSQPGGARDPFSTRIPPERTYENPGAYGPAAAPGVAPRFDGRNATPVNPNSPAGEDGPSWPDDNASLDIRPDRPRPSALGRSRDDLKPNGQEVVRIREPANPVKNASRKQSKSAANSPAPSANDDDAGAARLAKRAGKVGVRRAANAPQGKRIDLLELPPAKKRTK